MSRAVIASDTGKHPDGVDGQLDRCLRRLGAGLSAAVRPGVGLWDAVEGKPSAPDHYGQLSAALALLLLRGADDGGWRTSLQAWLDTPREKRGHAPFNRFLLYLLEESLPAGEDELRCRLMGERRACELRFRYPSNNWTLLAGVCRLLEAADAKERTHCTERLLQDLEAWTTDAGGFIDFPARGRPGATPIAYHHKALFLVAVASRRTGDERLESCLNRMLAWSAMSWDEEAGYAGGLGRSNHALYGDACLLATLTLLGYARGEHRETCVAALMRSMLERWLNTARSDGLLPLNPAAEDGQHQGWDSYMRLSVYNAWAAAILAWARAQEASVMGPAAFVRVESDPQAGVQRLQGGGLLVLMSGRGQPPQAFSLHEAEFRYAGGVPFHASLGGEIVCPPPVRIDSGILRTQPACAGWTPVFESDGVLYALDDFERCDVSEGEAGIGITLEGSPVQLLRSAPVGLWAQLRHAIDWRLLHGALGRHDALNRPRLHGVHARLVLTIPHGRPALIHQLHLRKEGDIRVRYLNPGGHALVGSRLPERKLHLRRGGDSQSVHEDEFIEAMLPASVRTALGACLAPVELDGGMETRLELSWAQELSPRSFSSSSR